MRKSSEWGDDYTGLLPLKDSQGNLVAALCMDVDVAQIHTTLRNSIIGSIVLILLLGIGFIVVFINWTGRNVTKPIEKLEGSVVEYASKCRNQKDPEALKLNVPAIQTNNEIATLAGAVSEMSEAIQDYVKGLAAKEALAEALIQAEEANKAKTVFLSNMSHEIRTPLNAIIGLNSIVLRDESISPHTREELEKSNASAQHLLSLINDILDMSRIESGRMVLKAETFSFRKLMEQITVIVGGQCEDKGLQYVCNMIDPLDEYYVGDDLKLKQIIINILGNSVKYTNAPGIITFTVEQTAFTDDSAILSFKMQDTGIGMDKEYIPKLFETFSQERNDDSNRYGGSGLGMAITKNFVEMTGGEIHVESEKGRGSVFTVTVSLGRVHDLDIPEALEDARDAMASAISLEGRHMLIAEDQEMNAEVLADLLELEGLTSEWAENGQRAVEMFAQSEERHFDAILMDMRMPVMDGLTAAKEIRKLGRSDAMTIPIIALTANAFEEDVKQCLQAGMNAHLAKPVDIDMLKDKLTKLLAGHIPAGEETESFALRKRREELGIDG